MYVLFDYLYFLCLIEYIQILKIDLQHACEMLLLTDS